MTWILRLEPEAEEAEFRLMSAPTGKEPVFATGPHCTAVLAGEVDARTLPPAEGGGSSPVDRLLAAYLRTGLPSFDSLRGRFVLVLWERRSRRLLAVRDPTGMHSLFYGIRGSEVVFSPAPRPVAGADGAVDAVAAAAYILGAPLAVERTLFEGVRRLPPGHVLEYALGRTSTRRYWLPTASPEEGRGAGVDWLERFEDAMALATERCLKRGPAAVYLSGGLDSAAVATAAADGCTRLGLPPPLALLALFRGTATDEEPIQRTVATSLRLPAVARTPEQLVASRGMLRAALDLAEMASAGPPQLVEPVYDGLGALARESGCVSVLSGIGGDDWLHPPQVFAPARLRTGDPRGLALLARAAAGYWPDFSWSDVLSEVFWGAGLRPLLRSPAVRVAERVMPAWVERRSNARVASRLSSWLAPDPVLRGELVSAIRERASRLPRGMRDAVVRTRRAHLDHPTLSGMLEQAFAAGERIGVTVCAPLLDPDVLSVLYAAPPERLVAHGRAKALAAEFAGARVPAYSRSWPRTVYGDSLWSTAFAREAARSWSELGGTPVLANLGVVDEKILEAHARAPSQQLTSLEPTHVIRALLLEKWLRVRILRAQGEVT